MNEGTFDGIAFKNNRELVKFLNNNKIEKDNIVSIIYKDEELILIYYIS